MFFLHVPILSQASPKLKITTNAEARERFQRRINKGVSDATNGNVSVFEQRYRAMVNFEYGDRWSGKFVYQYGLALNWTAQRNFSVQNSDVYIAEADYKSDLGTFRIGRQTIDKCDRRFVEESDFGQRQKAYDLVRYQGHGLDLFAGKVGFYPVEAEKSRIAGGTYDWVLGESLVLFKHDQWINHEDIWTLDQRYPFEEAGFNGALEGAIQKGRDNGLSMDTWFLHAKVAHPIVPNVSLYIDGNTISGGKNGSTTHLFDPLFGPAHALYGRANMVGERNLNDIELGAYWGLKNTQEVGVSYNKFALRDPRDGWYTTSGTLQSMGKTKFIDPSGHSGRDLGQELDLWAKFPTMKRYQDRNFIGIELAMFQPGNFIRAFNGSHTVNQVWGTVYYYLKF